MTQPFQLTHISATTDDLIANFLYQSEGEWHSDRRYYTLPDGKTQELVSRLTVQFLDKGCPELLQLAELHGLEDSTTLLCGSRIIWKSANSISGQRQSEGTTVFGVWGTSLYRDRGFATPHPVIAQYSMPDANTLCLRTEYNNSVFEEEIKHIGQKYRTRQSIISRAGEQQMIGQYLEKRIR
ncbi:MAG: phycobiliprotein lyase [Microcoleaceae cyanobacterium]